MMSKMYAHMRKALSEKVTVWGRLGLALIPGALSLALGLGLLATGRWSTFGVPTSERHFGDLLVILFTSQCSVDDPSWSIISNPCNVESSIYNYPTLWAKFFALVHIGPASASTITAVFIIVFALAVSALTYTTVGKSTQWLTLIVLSIAATSPPVLLAFERGNIDILVFGATTASILLLIRGLSRSSAVLLAFATTMKLFPAGSILMFLANPRHKRATLWTYGFVTIAGLALILRDLPSIYARTPALDGAAFGSALLPLLALSRLGVMEPVTLGKTIGIALFLLVLLLEFAWFRSPYRRSHAVTTLIRELRADPAAGYLLLGGGGSFVAAYLIGPSFDYRLITLIPVIAGLSRIASRLSLGLAVLMLAQMLLSYSTFIGPAQYLSDLAWLVFAPTVTLLMFSTLLPGRYLDHSVLHAEH
jgi:Glycosyltransferase family 87